MEIFKLDKAFENENLDLEMAIYQLKKEKEQLSQYLKGRKDLVIQMNDHLYTEERIEDLHLASSSEEENEAIKEHLGKNDSLHEEVRKIRREREIQSIMVCENMEKKNKKNTEIEGK